MRRRIEHLGNKDSRALAQVRDVLRLERLTRGSVGPGAGDLGDSGASWGVAGGPSTLSAGTVLATLTEPVFRTEADPELALSAALYASLHWARGQAPTRCCSSGPAAAAENMAQAVDSSEAWSGPARPLKLSRQTNVLESPDRPRPHECMCLTGEPQQWNRLQQLPPPPCSPTHRQLPL